LLLIALSIGEPGAALAAAAATAAPSAPADAGARAGAENSAVRAKVEETAPSKGASPAKAAEAPAAEKAAAPAKSEEASKAAKDAARSKAQDAAATVKNAEAAGAAPTLPALNVASMRDEARRGPARQAHTPPVSAEREKMERLAAEINKSREALRRETARLEALVAAREMTSNGAGGGGDSGEPVKKIPTSLDGLAKAMRGMKPEQAAPIISRLERKTAADVLQRMPAVDAGKVLGVCKPEVAAELAAEIASRTPHAELRR
jgi:flagellar motility protein MotE (MotC chaperone)